MTSDKQKFTIELTKEQIKSLQAFNEKDFPNFGFYINQEQIAQIREQLPKEKKWKFYRARFGDTAFEGLMQEDGISRAGHDYCGPNAYCFTAEQFEDAVREAMGFRDSSDNLHLLTDVKEFTANYLKEQTK